jgi:hypothetical protein
MVAEATRPECATCWYGGGDACAHRWADDLRLTLTYQPGTCAGYYKAESVSLKQRGTTMPEAEIREKGEKT